ALPVFPVRRGFSAAGDMAGTSYPPATSRPPALRQVTVRVDAAVTEERPDPAEVLHLLVVHVVVEDLLLLRGGLCHQFAIRVRHEGTAPELRAIMGATAVDGGEVAAVCHGMAALHRFPCAVLGYAEYLFFRRQPADRR